MPRGLPKSVKDNIEKCRQSAISAVEAYNRPGPRFRTAQFLVLIIMAWTALFHAYFYKRNKKPWYRKSQKEPSRGVRYVKVDGEPKHWELSECLKQYFGDKYPPVRKNLDFLIGLRNKIEHRHLPELDASLYGECQAALINLEDFLSREFGAKHVLAEYLAISLQFSQIIPPEKKKAVKILASSEAKSVKEYVEKFRGKLSTDILNSIKYSFSVFFVPKVANRQNTADAVVEFIPVDEASEQELERLEKLNILIKQKHIPISNLDLCKPGQVLKKLKEKLPYKVNMSTHTICWKHFKVRPDSKSTKPEQTRPEYCIYDEPHKDYLYTQAWINKIIQHLSTEEGYRNIIGSEPKQKILT